MIPQAIFGVIHMYGVMVAIGVLMCLMVLEKYGKKLGISQQTIDFTYYNLIFTIAFGFCSAAVFQALYEYIKYPERGFHINGDITFLGGLIGGTLFFFAVYFIRRKKLVAGEMRRVLTILPCCITIGHGFGRIGCFCAGCCYGKPTDSFLGVHFPSLPGPVHPTQLYEAFFLFVLFGVLTWILFKVKGTLTFPVYLMGYGVFRFLIEFIRDDERGSLVGSLTPSQFWSVLMVVLGIALLVIALKRKEPETVEATEEAADAEAPEETSDADAPEEATDGETPENVPDAAETGEPAEEEAEA